MRVNEKLRNHNLMPHPVAGWVVLGPSGAKSWAARPGLHASVGGRSVPEPWGVTHDRSGGEEEQMTAQDRQKCWQGGEL